MTGLRKLAHSALASEKRLIALCYVLFFAVSVLVCLASFAEDAFQRAIGNVVPAQLDVNSFSLIDTQQTQPGHLHLHLAGPPHGAGAFARLCAHCDGGLHLQQDPGEFCIFYKTSPQQESMTPRAAHGVTARRTAAIPLRCPRAVSMACGWTPAFSQTLPLRCTASPSMLRAAFLVVCAKPSMGAGAGGGAAAGGGCAEKCARAVGAAAALRRAGPDA